MEQKYYNRFNNNIIEEKEPSKTTIYAVYAVMLIILALEIYAAT